MHDRKLQKIVAANRLGAVEIVPKGVIVVTCALEAAIMLHTNLVSLIP
jgi:hypothetical protein